MPQSGPNHQPYIPAFENLESRVLLTTIVAGDFFVYRNSQGDSVRVELTDDGTHAIPSSAELMTIGFNQTGDILPGSTGGLLPQLIDTPGILFKGGVGTGRLDFFWPQGAVHTTVEAGVETWTEPGEYDGTLPIQYQDSGTEIYAIYFAASYADTRLTLTTLSAADFDPNSLKWNAINPWETAADTLPNIYYDFDAEAYTQAPEGSGGVIVGSLLHQAVVDPESKEITIRYKAVDGASAVSFPTLGVFPGGPLHAGVTIPSAAVTLSPSILGTDVGALAINGSGHFYAVDSSLGSIVSDNSRAGLGSDVQALAVNSTGVFSAVRNDQTPIVFTGMNNELGANMVSMAANGATVYTFSEDALTQSQLRSWSRAGGAGIVGTVVWADEHNLRFDNVRAMDFHDGFLYGIASSISKINPSGNGVIPTTNGPFLIKIDVTTGNLLTVEVTEYQLIPVADGNFTAMAFDPTTDDLYAVNSANNTLVTITDDPANPGKLLAGTSVNLTAGDSPLEGVQGIDFVGDTLYAVTASKLYTLDAASGEATEVVVAGNTLRGMTSLTAGNGVLITNTQIDGKIYPVYIPFGSTVEQVFPTASGDLKAGRKTDLSSLYKSGDPLTVYTDVTALAYGSAGALYAVGRPLSIATAGAAPGARTLIRLSTNAQGVPTGVVTEIAPIAGMVAMSFDGTTMYGVNSTNRLVTINTGTGATTDVGALSVLSHPEITITITGIAFIDNVLYGVTTDSIYAINKANGQAVLVGDAGVPGLTGLAYDTTQDGLLWSVAADTGGNYRLVRAGLAATLLRTDALGSITTIGGVRDSVDPNIAYKSIYSLDFGSDDTIAYAVGVTSPVNPLLPGAAGVRKLIAINVATGVATAIADLLANWSIGNDANLTSLAFDSVTNRLYGVVEGTNRLIAIDLGAPTNAPVVIGTAPNGIVGIDFRDGILYGITESSLYTINTVTGLGTKLIDYSLPGILSALATEPTLGADSPLWATMQLGDSYRLVQLTTDPTALGHDIGRVKIAGTLASALSVSGNIEALQTGFLWADVTSEQNIGAVITVMGGRGVLPEGADEYVGSATYTIFAGGSVGFVNSMDGFFDYTIIGANSAGVTAVQAPIVSELEWTAPPDTDPEVIIRAWLHGEFTDYTNADNNTAQYINHPTGEIVVWGDILPGTQDTFALPLMAGQTIRLNGASSHLALESEVQNSSSLLWSAASVFLYDSTGHMMGTLGYETIEDAGVGSMGSTQKPLTFTAPSAGIYYLAVNSSGLVSMDYTLFISGAAEGVVGGVNVVGDYGAEGFTRAVVEARRGGDLGAIHVTESAVQVRAYAYGGGNLVCFEAGTIGGDGSEDIGYLTNTIYSDSNIGRVASTTGGMSTTIRAGSQLYNENAYIQNIFSAGTVTDAVFITATGNLGVMEVLGSLQARYISVNDDGVGTPGRAEAIIVAGSWGGVDADGFVATGPRLLHGPGGDYGFISIGAGTSIQARDIVTAAGRLYASKMPDAGDLLPDDGGGHLRVTPGVGPLLDEQGEPVLDLDGLPVFKLTDVYYILLPVDDGVGGVIVSMEVNGPATFTNDGVVNVSDLVLTGTTDFTMGGTGSAHLYGVKVTGELKTFTNSTAGRLVSGDFESVKTMTIKGDIGAFRGPTGEWVAGATDAPLETPFQFGYLHGKINGVQIIGDLGTLNVAGSLGDLRVTGAIGAVTVNAGGVTAPGHWDGVAGVIWSGTSIGTVNVGDGLADDGTADVAQAGIFSSGPIGTVKVQGRRYERDGFVFHELNGAIIATGDINKVIGTDGAQSTALILSAELNSFQTMKITTTAFSGIVNLVSFSGNKAKIYNCEIGGSKVNTVKVVTSDDTFGLDYVYIVAARPDGAELGVGSVTSDGKGLNRVYILVQKNGIGRVSALGGVADIVDSYISAAANINLISARDFINNTFTTPGTIKVMKAARDMHTLNTVNVGGLGSVTVGRNFDFNRFTVAGIFGSLKIKGHYDWSHIIMQGPTVAHLKYVYIKGDMTGSILSAGKVGKVIVGGASSADISTITRGSYGNFGLLQVGNGFTGTLEVAGTLSKFISRGTVGTPPLAGGSIDTYNIWGGLGLLRVQRTLTDDGDLMANINVGGKTGTIQVDGTLYGGINTNDDVGKLIFGGALGGILDGVARGSVDILGKLGQLSFNTSQDLVADLIIGGSIKALTMKGGDILGDIISRNGSIGSITVNAGNIEGEITANAIGKIAVNLGSVNGNITTNRGDLGSLTIKGGDLNSDVTVNHGDLKLLSIANGDATAGHTISATGDIGTVSILNGDLDADLVAGGLLGKVTITGSDINGKIDAQGGIGSIMLSGTVRDTTIRSGMAIGSFTAGALDGATISSASNIGKFTVAGNVTDSHVMAGYDIGPDAIENTADDNAANNGNVHFGSILSVAIAGTMGNSVLSAGIGMGPDGDFFTTGDNQTAAGVSSITKMSVGGYDDSSSVAVLADSLIDPVYLGFAAATGVMIYQSGNDPIASGGASFGEGAASNTITVGGMTLTISGGGTGYFDQATNTLVLNGTTSKTKVTLTGSYANAITIVGQGDRAVGSLVVSPDIEVEAVNIDGPVGTLTLPNASDSAAISLPAGVTSGLVDVGGGGLNLTAGAVGKFTVVNGMSDGTFQADSIKTLMFTGEMGGLLSTIMGGASSVSIAGEMSGQAIFMGNVGRFIVGSSTVPSALTGSLTMPIGDLTTLTVSGDLTGAVEVEHGFVKTAKSGNFARYASDGFESGGGFGGSGWAGIWSLGGSASVVSAGAPDNGLYHLRLRANNGEALREVDLAGVLSAHLAFDWKASNFTAGATAVVEIYDGTDWIVVQTIEDGQDDNTYHHSNIELSNLTSDFKIRFRSLMNAADEYFYVDNVLIKSNTAVRVEQGVSSFTTGDFSGMLGSVWASGTLNTTGVFSGQVAVGGLKAFKAWSMNGGLVTSRGDITSVSIRTDMQDGMILAGFDPGDAGFEGNGGTELGNMQLDAVVAPVDGSPNVDTPTSGSIKTVTIGGDMIASSIGAAVSPGSDRFIGNNNDIVRGTGTIGKVTVKRDIVGTGLLPGESYGIYAANNMPSVKSYGRKYVTSGTQDNARAAWVNGMAGSMRVIQANVKFNSITIYFDHPLDYSTINTDTMQLEATTTNDFSVVSDLMALNPTVTYNEVEYSVTVRFTFGWEELGVGSLFRMTLDGDAVTDNRQNLLDGETDNGIPSGNGVPGGDFVHIYGYAQTGLIAAPFYEWYHGCTPTSVGMLVGYYDGQVQYSDLINGDAFTATPDVLSTIASAEHIAEYAEYGGEKEEFETDPVILDLSSIDPASAHANNSIADFLGTSRSAGGSTYGGTPILNIEDGVEMFFAYKGFASDAELEVWDEFTFEDYIAQIDAGQPVLLNVDSSGDGWVDHTVLGVGYDRTTNEYLFNDPNETEVQKAAFDTTSMVAFGIHSFVTVELIA